MAAVVVAVLAARTHLVKEPAVVFFAVLIPSIILHEISHGVVALWFGDTTARDAGRLTLNPLPHVDLFGTVLLPAMMILSGGGAFGYAKPVPVRVDRLRNPRRDSLLVSLAGPTTNFALVAVAITVFRTLSAAGVIVVVRLGPTQFAALRGHLLADIIFTFGLANVILGVFNLLPIPPLDGSALLEWLIPNRYLGTYLKFRQYSMLIFIVLIFRTHNLFGFVLNPAIRIWLKYVI